MKDYSRSAPRIADSCFQIMTTGPQRKVGRLAGATQLGSKYFGLKLHLFTWDSFRSIAAGNLVLLTDPGKDLVN
jgi:hypothetical protein